MSLRLIALDIVSKFSCKKYIFRCKHIILALEATEMAPSTTLNISELDELTDSQRQIVQKNSKNSTLEIYSLPGGNICVPLLDVESEDLSTPFTHVMNGKVLLEKLTQLLASIQKYYTWK